MVLDAARRFAKEQMFRVGVQIIEGTTNAEHAGPAFANIAESVIAGLFRKMEAELTATAGPVPGGAFAVVAMGKLGGREITAASDLDLVFIYDMPEGLDSTDGPKPLPVSVFYGKLAQRLIAALTVPTTEGVLYDVDMRLRPTGNKGPVAVSLESFARYHAGESWTWERMALTRARVIYGDDTLAEKINTIIANTLARPVSTQAIRANAADMRDKLAAQFPGKNRWDLKFAPGGLVDIEFVAQTLQLVTRSAVNTNTVAALQTLAEAGAINGADAQTLISTARIENALTQVLRIAVEGTLEPAVASQGLKTLLARAAGARDFEALEESLAGAQARVREIFNHVVRAA
jgi:glutamate-ammonia-ligase adenylyltransferase